MEYEIVSLEPEVLQSLKMQELRANTAEPCHNGEFTIEPRYQSSFKKGVLQNYVKI